MHSRPEIQNVKEFIIEFQRKARFILVAAFIMNCLKCENSMHPVFGVLNTYTRHGNFVD